VVLGKAKVMSYEDIKEARAKHAAKEKATAGKVKGKRDRKYKCPAPEVGSSEAVLKPAKALVVPWRAQVARMY
jgi:hypothetical protein